MLEKFAEDMNVDETCFYGHAWLKKEWIITQQALFRMAMHHVLSPLARRVIKYVFFDGYTEKEAALKLKLSENKIHSIKCRALERLNDSTFVKLALSHKELRREAV